MTSVFVNPSQALARKRRKEILASHKSTKRQRIVESEDDTRDDTTSVSGTARTTTPTKRSKPVVACKGKVIKSNTKYQNRYEPDVPMTKEQEAAWRKEARRQRNRESAAASRNKVRNRIHELENEVQEWKNKYASLIKRLDLLEKSPRSSSTIIPSSPNATPKTIYVPCSISTCSEEPVSMPLTLNYATDSHHISSSPSSSLLSPKSNIQQTVTNHVDHHVIEINSRSRPAESR